MENQEYKKKFLEYVQQHPEYYPVMQAEVFVRILKALSKEAKSMDDAEGMLPNIDRQDLEAMIETLLKIKLLSKITSANQVLYYTNEKGKEFLSYYDLAKKKFEVA